MITLSRSDIEALHECLGESHPVEGRYLQAMTGLDIRQLLESGIVRTIGRWDTQLFRGPAWDSMVEKGRQMSTKDTIGVVLRDPDHEIGNEMKQALKEGKKLFMIPPHLRDDAPFIICSHCERKSWGGDKLGDDCRMPQPDGRRCKGKFITLEEWNRND